MHIYSLQNGFLSSRPFRNGAATAGIADQTEFFRLALAQTPGSSERSRRADRLALRVFAKLAIFTRKREGKETPSIEGLEFITKYVNDG
jgi:hypothetical protein